MHRTETGKQRTNMGATNAGKGEEELARVTVRAEAPEQVIVPAAVQALAIDPEVLEQVIVPVAVQALATDPEVLEQVIGLVEVQALVIVLAAVREPVTGQAEAVPERDPVVVVLRTKWVTAAHLRDLVPLLVAEVDLVAVAEIMREPAAAEAATAWAAEE
jgi:hypothetical protein